MPKIFGVVYMPSSYRVLGIRIDFKIRKPTKTYARKANERRNTLVVENIFKNVKKCHKNRGLKISKTQMYQAFKAFCYLKS
jgi:hypothetical protein